VSTAPGQPSRGSLGELGGWRLRALVALGLAAVLLPMAWARLIDGDEGFYLVAARLVAEGKRPYEDFFLPMVPILAYVHGGWCALLGRGWYLSRTLSGLIAVGIGVLVFEHAFRASRRRAVGLAAAALYAAAGMTLGWLTIVKTYGLALLLLLAALLVLQTRARFASLACGALLALAAGVRLYVVVAFAAAALHLLRRENPRPLRELGLLAAGGVLGLVPLLPAILGDWEAFSFGAFRFYGMREYGQSGFVTGFAQKLEILATVLPLRTMAPGTVQLAGLLLLAVAALLSRQTPRNAVVAYTWLALFVTSLVPSPAYAQYFCMLVPLLAIEGAVLLGTLPLRPLAPLLAPAAALYLAMGVYDVRRFASDGTNVPGVYHPANAINWKIASVVELGRALDAQNAEVGASWWPGYFATTRTPIVTELANDFAIHASARLTPAGRQRFHVTTDTQMLEMIKTRRPRLWVAGNWAPPEATLLPASGFRQAAQVGAARLFVADP
jgi:hypothetical protein